MAKQIYIHRQIEPTLKKLSKQFPALALTGPRQSGKSTLLLEIFGKTHKYVSFDDPLAREQAISDPKFFLENNGERLILDEIQYVPQILSYVKMLIDKNRNKKGIFIFTGSQQFNMIKNLGDTLAGRIALFNLLPFSVSEKKMAPALKKQLLDMQNYFIHACLRGSFPELMMHKEINFDAWYGGYLQTYLERDIRTIYDIGNLRDFQRFMQLLAARCAQILNLSSLSSDLGVAVNTIKRWVSILEASRIIYLLPPYYQNLGKRIAKNPKIYFFDCGFVCYLAGIQDKKYLLKGSMAGALFENFCIQETCKYFFNHGIQPRLFYLRSHNDLEVDLLIEHKGKLWPIEIKLTKTPAQAMAAPVYRFRKLFSKLNIMQGKILSLSEEQIQLTKEVSVWPLSEYFNWLEMLAQNKVFL